MKALVLSIEQLLVWAYRDQLVHVARREDDLIPSKVRGAAVLRYKTLTDVFTLGTHVDSSQSIGFTAHPDAFAVHDAVKTLTPIDARVPDETFGQCAPGLHESALPYVEPSFTVNRARLVQAQALAGQRPDWIEEPILIVEKGDPIYAKTRRGEVKRDGMGRRIVHMVMVQFVGDMPWEVERARITYQIWAQALAELRDVVSSALEKHTLNDVLPSCEPWKQLTLRLDRRPTLDIGSGTFTASRGHKRP